jgi:hypothetical protein
VQEAINYIDLYDISIAPHPPSEGEIGKKNIDSMSGQQFLIFIISTFLLINLRWQTHETRPSQTLDKFSVQPNLSNFNR